MDALKRSRRPVRNGVNKKVAELERLSAVEPLPKDRMILILEALTEEQNSLTELDNKVLECMVLGECSDKDIDAEYEAIDDLKLKIRAARMKAERELSEPLTISSSSGVGGSEIGAGLRSYRLPKFELKVFSGELKDWLGYWAQFEKIDKDASLDGSDKFQYLLQSLKPGTNAYEVASSYPQSSENYPKVVEALKRRYGNEDLLLQVYIRELLKLVISNVNSPDKMPFPILHLKLESHMRALKTLKLEKADPATWLFPLVESSLPEDILLTWQRSSLSSQDGSQDEPPRTRLDLLMEFLEKEVDIQQKISLARGGFDLENKGQKEKVQKKKQSHVIATLATCPSGEIGTCLFCEMSHETKECKTAKSWAVEQKRSLLKVRRLCFVCFKAGHLARACKTKSKLKCLTCNGQHYPVMCPNIGDNPKVDGSFPDSNVTGKSAQNSTGLVNQTCSKKIALQTLVVTAYNGNKKKQVRVFLDNGSQGSYVLKSLAEELGLEVKAVEDVTHTLFGGTQTEVIRHKVYNLVLEELDGGYSCIVGVRDQEKICNFIPRVSESSTVMNEANKRGIKLSDVGEEYPPIEVLLGADVYGKILKGKVSILPSGVTAINTKLGWTLCGKMEGVEEESVSMCTLSMVLQDTSISQLWDLDVIGIQDNTDVKTARQIEEEDKKKFFEGLSRNDDGRYVVSLPWEEGHPPLPTNYEVAKKRLQSTTRKLEGGNLFEAYSKLFEDWKKEGFIEDVPYELVLERKVHYVPHRAVIKMSSATTPVRPVFDASCKVGKFPSLNDCLKKGSNYIKLIPEILLHFREKRVGFVSDIRKAFQMIEVREEDRDCMRFLWWKDRNKQELLEYRHVRVMFGANCSPFILGAVLEYHLKNVDIPDKVVAERLLKTLYMDNCVSSENTVEEYIAFREKSTDLLAEAGMDLRLWMSNKDEVGDPSSVLVPVLGMMWDRVYDEMFVDVKDIVIPEVVTKRTLLSCAQKVFDPMGIVCPAVVPVKIILQKTFINKMKWDEPLPQEERKLFFEWVSQVRELNQVRIPRCFTEGESDRRRWSLHAFTDASGVAYGAVLFLRVEHKDHVTVQLVEARARVTPIKKMTIPRLELLACLIGARLVNSVKKTLNLDQVLVNYYSDSTTALAWIKRTVQWGTYIANRVKEIRLLTDLEQWRHIPGAFNPADLPSRGCSPRQLIEKRWWEGPAWLKESMDQWPSQYEEVSEEEVNAERRKASCTSVSFSLFDNTSRTLTFRQSIRVMTWCRRFIMNARNKRRQGSLQLTNDELIEGEKYLILCIQQELDEKSLRKLGIFMENGILRVKTKLTFTPDEEYFRCPAVLSGKSVLVKQLILDTHRLYCHAGTGFLMTKLRDKYWILKARKTINSIINKCNRCRRLSAKPFVTVPPPLPIERVQEAGVFEVIGADLVGPFYLKNNKKVWVVIFTCAVFRAVRLEVISSLTSVAFIEVLKQFVRMNGRPRVIFSDNGTNFHGAANFFRSLDWKALQRVECIEPIQWKFNVALAPWWGGFWERLIRVMKDLMKRTIGSSSLNRRELEDLLLIVEEIMNGRPLTYVTEKRGELEPLTPSMFMKSPGGLKFPEGCGSEAEQVRVRWKYLANLKKELHLRFRKEYLSQLVSRAKDKPTRPIKVGELVLIGNDRKKRVMWPLARVVELVPGKDGVVRVAKVKTGTGIDTRPVQLLYPLELDLETCGFLESHLQKSEEQ